MMDSVPFLRSPPFPGTRAAVAAVSQPKPLPAARSLLTQPELERARLIIERIVADRIGGTFWSSGAADPWHIAGQGGPIPAQGSDELGLIAWIAGKDVTWQGPGRFADIALDGAPDPLERAVTTWLIDAADYRDPYSGRPVPIEAAIEQLAFWRHAIDRNRGLAVAAGIARWKRREVEAMLWPGEPL